MGHSKGFHWVKHKSVWTIGHFDGHCNWTIWGGLHFNSALQFEEIKQIIEPPVSFFNKIKVGDIVPVYKQPRWFYITHVNGNNYRGIFYSFISAKWAKAISRSSISAELIGISTPANPAPTNPPEWYVRKLAEE